MSDLVWKFLSELGRLIASREVSPVEVVQAHLDRIAAVDGKLGAYLTVTAEAAIESARQAEAAVMAGGSLGALHGVPLALKDLYCTRGVKTTAGLSHPGRVGPGRGRHGGVAARRRRARSSSASSTCTSSPTDRKA